MNDLAASLPLISIRRVHHSSSVIAAAGRRRWSAPTPGAHALDPLDGTEVSVGPSHRAGMRERLSSLSS